MKSQEKFQFGDRVRHRQRPEWGIGSVMKAEESTVNGQVTQRLSVRFPNAGVKTLAAGHADLERLTDDDTDPLANGHRSIEAWDRMRESGWPDKMAERKIEEVMTSLPEEARDPFRSLRDRLLFSLQLYRFDRSGRGLVDWAVAQSGLEDPLSRFTRHELEQHFDRWAFERDNHLRRLLEEARREGGVPDDVLKASPPAGRDAVRRITAQR
ncbi:MAG: DUF3553 domain-containing protein [Planctomycetota bacterium]